MKLRARILWLPLLAALSGAAVAGTVQVKFLHPESYADIGTDKWDEGKNMDTIARHLEALGAKYLPANETLAIDVLDVDLAGTVRPPNPRHGPVRVLNGRADAPQIHLTYVLSGPGLARSGDETITDLDYIHGRTAVRNSDSLYYDKRMLTDWFVKRFGQGRTD